jgi:hypothetical protein
MKQKIMLKHGNLDILKELTVISRDQHIIFENQKK